MVLLLMMFHWTSVITSAISSDCSDQFASTLNGGLRMTIQVLMGLGVAVAVIGAIAGGLMRATSSWLALGSEEQEN